MNTISYMLEVYEPESKKDCICSYTAETAFPSIAEGEILDFLYLEKRVRATEIIHLVWQNEDRVSFKTLIYTENSPS
jgi:hypothetical protein